MSDKKQCIVSKSLVFVICICSIFIILTDTLDVYGVTDPGDILINPEIPPDDCEDKSSDYDKKEPSDCVSRIREQGDRFADPEMEDDTTSPPIPSTSSCDDCISPTLGKTAQGEQIIQGGFSFNNNTIDVVSFHTDYPLIITKINQTNTIIIKTYENKGTDNIEIVQFGFGVPEIGSPLSQAETLVEVWFESADTKIKEIIIKDKYNLIDNEFLSVLTQNVQCSQDNTLVCLEIVMNYRYLESPLYSVVVVSISDQSKNTVTNYFNDGIQVDGESLNPPDMIKVSASLSGNHLYPQQRGLVELEQIDRKAQLWKDVFGYIWQEHEQSYYMISEIEFEPKFQNDTLNDAIQLEIIKAQEILNSYLRFDSIY